MSFASEFRTFVLRGNVVDLAVGIIIGAAFAKIVDSLVNDLIMPVVGRVTGGLDFSNYFVPLRDVPPGTAHTLAAVKAAGVPVVAYGNFVSVALNFLILGLVIFLMVRQVNRMRRPAPAAAVAPAEDIVLLREIRDALRR
jgi:large conductance mechanosensitive channel